MSASAWQPQVGGRRRLAARITAAVGSSIAVGLLATSAAAAATTLGSTAYIASAGCSADFTSVQAVSPPGTSYAAASRGVITRWQFHTGPDPVQLKLKVLRSAGAAGSFTVVGATETAAVPANSALSFAARIPVQAGDLLGITPKTTGACAVGAPGGAASYVAGDLGLGTTATFADAPGTALPLAATLEPDADGDGYGDETQDACPQQATTQGACDLDPPQTRIKRGPQPTYRTTARFVFVSDEAGSTFECRLKGEHAAAALRKYRPCTSPKTYQHLVPGDYKFQARAIDPVGNRDRTPDHWKWRVRPR